MIDDARCCICGQPTHTLDELPACLKALKERGDTPTRVATSAVMPTPMPFELRCPPCGRLLVHKAGGYRCEKCKVVI